MFGLTMIKDYLNEILDGSKTLMQEVIQLIKEARLH